MNITEGVTMTASMLINSDIHIHMEYVKRIFVVLPLGTSKSVGIIFLDCSIPTAPLLQLGFIV